MSRVVSVWHLAHALHIHEQVEEGLEFRGRVHKHTRFSPWMKDITVHDLILLCLPNKLNQCKCVCFDLFNMAYSKCVGNLINWTATMPTKVGQEQRQSGSTGSSWAKTPRASLQRSCLHPALITLHRSHHMLILSLKPPSNNNLPKKNILNSLTVHVQAQLYTAKILTQLSRSTNSILCKFTRMM